MSRWCRRRRCCTRVRPTWSSPGRSVAARSRSRPVTPRSSARSSRTTPGCSRPTAPSRTSPSTAASSRSSGNPTKVSILSDTAELAQDIDVERAKEALERHQHMLRDQSLEAGLVESPPPVATGRKPASAPPARLSPPDRSTGWSGPCCPSTCTVGSCACRRIRSRPRSSPVPRPGSAPRSPGCSVRQAFRRCSSLVAATVSGRSPTATTASRCSRPTSGPRRARRSPPSASRRTTSRSTSWSTTPASAPAVSSTNSTSIGSPARSS